MNTNPIQPTTLPCPDWCDGPTGHGFPDQLPDGKLMRYHEATIGSFPYRDMYTHSVKVESVRVVAEERAISNDGPVTMSGDPFINAPEVIGMDGAVAEDLRGALWQALELWRRIVPPVVLDVANREHEAMYERAGIPSGYEPVTARDGTVIE